MTSRYQRVYIIRNEKCTTSKISGLGAWLTWAPPEQGLEQGREIIFVRGPHCTFLGASRAGFQSKMLL
jgi:hypothetical protein